MKGPFLYLYQRHLLKKISWNFLAVIFSLFFLYSLIDYSIHMQDFLEGEKIRFLKLIAYYGFEFIKRSELLIPLSFLIATIHTLTHMNAAKELVALIASGISIRSIVKPLWILALALSFFQLTSQQYIQPKARTYLDTFKYKHIKSVKRSRASAPFYMLYLADGSRLFYLKKADGVYSDVIWYRSFNEIWRMKKLYEKRDVNIGYFVDVIERTSNGFMEKTTSFKETTLPILDLSKASLYKSAVPAENLSLVNLLENIQEANPFLYSKNELKTEFYSKIFSSFLPLWVLLAIIPTCIIYRRYVPIFVIYSLSIFLFLAFKTMVDSLKIIGIHNVLAPLFAIGVPYALLFVFFLRKYKKQLLA